MQSVEFKQDGLYQEFKSHQFLSWQLNEAFEILHHVKPLIDQTGVVIGQIPVKMTDSFSI